MDVQFSSNNHILPAEKFPVLIQRDVPVHTQNST